MIEARLYLGQYYITTMALSANHPPEYVFLAVFDKLPMVRAKVEDCIEATEHRVARFKLDTCLGSREYKYCLEDLR